MNTPANPSVETTSATVESPAELPKVKVEKSLDIKDEKPLDTKGAKPLDNKNGKPIDTKTRKPLNIKSLDDIEFDFSDIKPPKSK